MAEEQCCGEASVASAIETAGGLATHYAAFSVAGKQASRLRLKQEKGYLPLLLLIEVAGKQASRLRLKHALAGPDEKHLCRCGEASVASAIETYKAQAIYREYGVAVAGKQASRLRLKHSPLFFVQRGEGVAGKQASRLRLKQHLQGSPDSQIEVAGKQASRLRLKPSLP